MNTVMPLIIFSMFCLMLGFLAVFARPATAKIMVKILSNVVTKLLKYLLP